MNAISVQHIFKNYGAVQALQDISLEVKKGELFGLIGPDGAGKSSLFRILTTLLLADRGKANIGDLDVAKDYRQIRRIIGYMPGRFSLYQDLSVYENLEFFATIFGTTIEENYDLIRDIYVQIEPFKDRKAGKLSGGMKQKLALCCAMVHQPQVLFLDEPTTGVDPVSRKEFWEILQRLREKGITLLVSTPYMDEASLCDRVALIHGGKILTVDAPRGIVAGFGTPLWSVQSLDIYPLLNELRKEPFTRSCFAFGESLHLTLEGGAENEEQLRAFIGARPQEKATLKPVSPGIEDCFMALMQKQD